MLSLFGGGTRTAYTFSASRVKTIVGGAHAATLVTRLDFRCMRLVHGPRVAHVSVRPGSSALRLRRARVGASWRDSLQGCLRSQNAGPLFSLRARDASLRADDVGDSHHRLDWSRRCGDRRSGGRASARRANTRRPSWSRRARHFDFVLRIFELLGHRAKRDSLRGARRRVGLGRTAHFRMRIDAQGLAYGRDSRAPRS